MRCRAVRGVGAATSIRSGPPSGSAVVQPPATAHRASAIVNRGGRGQGFVNLRRPAFVPWSAFPAGPEAEGNERMTHSMTYPGNRTINRAISCATRAATRAAALAVVLAATAPAHAGSDVLIRQTAPSFAACVAVQDAMMRNLGVEPAMLAVEMDTGGMLMRKYASAAADLVLSCNRVTDVLEVRRVTPGTNGKDEPRVVATGETATL